MPALQVGARREEGHREIAQARVRAPGRLHEIGRDWSLIAEPGEFHRMVTSRLAALIGAPICVLVPLRAVDAHARRGAPRARHSRRGGAEDALRRPPEYRSLWNFRSGRAYLSNRARTDPRLVQEMVDGWPPSRWCWSR